jgi:hypothetical protein
MAHCLVSENFSVRKIAQELLTVVCYNENQRGHKMVLRALDYIKMALKENGRHQTWMEFLRAAIHSKESIGGGASGGIVAGVGWVGDSKVTDKDIMDYLVSIK